MLSRTSSVDGKLWHSNSYNQKTVRRFTTDRLYKSVGDIIKSRYVKSRLKAGVKGLVNLSISSDSFIIASWVSCLVERFLRECIIPCLPLTCTLSQLQVYTVYCFARFFNWQFCLSFLKVSVAFLLFPSQKALLINQGIPCKRLLLSAILSWFTTRRKSRSHCDNAWALNKSRMRNDSHSREKWMPKKGNTM